MSHLIICLGKDFRKEAYSVMKTFDNIYILGEGIDSVDSKAFRPDQKVSLLLMPDDDSRKLSESLYTELKTQLSKDKIVDLDIAVSIISGSGRLHSATISAVMKLGYGVRLVDVDEKGNLVEL